KDPAEVHGVNVVCKDKAVFRLQFLGRETFVDNDVGKLRVTPAFVDALNKEVGRRAGCDIDVVARKNGLPERVVRRTEEFRKLLAGGSGGGAQGKEQVEGILPAEDGQAVLALLAAGKYEPLDWSEERWDKELADLDERGAGEFNLAPGLGFQLPLLVSGEKE